MDIVYACLMRRQPSGAIPRSDVAEVLDALWAHARPDDGLEHASGRTESDRIDLLLYFCTRTPHAPSDRDGIERASTLLARSHRASPVLNRRFLPPQA